jgi:hypothetical protein
MVGHAYPPHDNFPPQCSQLAAPDNEIITWFLAFVKHFFVFFTK